MNRFKKSPVISLKAYEVKTEKHSRVEVKGRPFFSLTYRKEGEAKIKIDNKDFLSRKNCVTLVPKNKTYTTQITENTNFFAIHFDCYDKDAFSTPFVLENVSPHVFELFEAILLAYSPKKSCNLECFSLFYELLSEIEKTFASKNEDKTNPKIKRAREEIEERFSDVSFNISELSSLLSINSSYLRREFKKAYSVTPITYLKKTRMQNAVSLLSLSGFSIEELAEKCGYASTSYFIQDFHKMKGCSPLKYKERYLDN